MSNLDPSYFELRYSGGPSNGDHNLSLGGAISSVRVTAQLITVTNPIPGVSVLHSSGSAVGTDGFLRYDATANTFSYEAPVSATGLATAAPTADGRMSLYDATNEKQLDIEVTLASLPTSGITTANIALADNPNQMYLNHSGADSANGKIDYRCFYFINTHPTESPLSLRVYMDDATTGVDQIRLGIGTSAKNGIEPAIANELIIPDEVLFAAYTTPTDAGSIRLPILGPGEFQAFWLRRDLFPANTTVQLLNRSTIGLQVETAF